MNVKSKVAIVSIIIVLLTAGVLGIKQKFFTDEASNDNTGTSTVLEEFNEKSLEVMTQIDSVFEKKAQEDAQAAANANQNINSNISDGNNNEIVNKLTLEYYPEAEIETELVYSEEKKISSITLATRDTSNTVLEYYRNRLGDQVQEIESIKDAGGIETMLVLFSSDSGEGELNVNIFDDSEKTHIRITISDSFADPR